MNDPEYLRQSRAKMDAFDKLPPTARKAIAEARYTWPVVEIYEAWKDKEKGFRSGRDIARRIAKWEAQRKEAEEARK